MPKRSNLHQAVIFYVKRHYAPPDVSVTESKMLYDPASDEEREVDVVVEGRLGDEAVCISIEVVARSRAMGPEWVGSMVTKHHRMVTTKLVLVSWSGFTRGARQLVDSYGGWVVALTPEVVPNASVKAPRYAEVTTTPEKAALLTRNDDGTLTKVTDVPVLANIYTAPNHDAYLCMLRDLVLRVINERGVGRNLLDEAHERDDRESLTHFSLESTGLDHHGLYVHDGDADEFRHISAFAVTGPFGMHEQSLDFTVMRLGDSIFAMSELQMGGKPAVWVVTNDDAQATVSWRLI
jgi:hypothetical protein